MEKEETIFFSNQKLSTTKYSYLCNMQLLLYPFSFLYAIITNIRNLLFDMGILPSKEFECSNVKEIIIEAVGGKETGKFI